MRPTQGGYVVMNISVWWKMWDSGGICWRLLCFRMWCHIIWQICSNIWEESAAIFRVEELCSEDKSNMLHWNVATYLPNCMVSHCRRHYSSLFLDIRQWDTHCILIHIFVFLWVWGEFMYTYVFILLYWYLYTSVLGLWDFNVRCTNLFISRPERA